MGVLVSKVLDLLGLSKKEMRILMVGLDAGGKMTILYRLQLGKVISVIPTIGFNVETVKYKRVLFTLWDIGNGYKFRPLWRHYYPNTQGVIFVVDSSDKDRLEEAKMELRRLSTDDALGDAVLLVFANKQDIPNAMTVAETTDKLELHSITRSWHIQGPSATTGEGLYEGLEWLAANVAKKT